MPSLLLLYTDNSTRQVLKSKHHLNDLGIKLILADNELLPQDRELFEDVIQLPHYARLEETIKVLENYCAAKQVDIVVAQTEYGLLPGALLANKLGLKGISKLAAMLCTNKWLSRSALQDHDVPVPRFALARNAQDVRHFMSSAGDFPVVLKGIASTMGRNVILVNSDVDVDRKVSEMLARIKMAPDLMRCQEYAKLSGIDMGCDPLNEFIVEEFVEGRPVETDGLIYGDQIETFGTSEQVVSESPNFFIEGYLFPADLTDGEKFTIESISTAALNALGLQETGFSVELRDSRRECKVIEVNGRLGEDDGFPDLFASSLGSYPIIRWMDYLTTGVLPDPLHVSTRSAVAYINCYSEGTVTSTPPKEILDALQSETLRVNVVVTPDKKMHAPPHPDAFPHLAYVLAKHPYSSRSAFVEARGAVRQLAFAIES
jgi:predicted ATP-grasp superfamily ATP-dependent carboligase